MNVRKSTQFATTKHYCYVDLPLLFHSWNMRPGEKTVCKFAINSTLISPLAMKKYCVSLSLPLLLFSFFPLFLFPLSSPLMPVLVKISMDFAVYQLIA